MDCKITLIPGDGIGPEIVREAVKVLDAVGKKYEHHFTYEKILMGGCSIDAYGVPLTDEAIAVAKASDAVLLGAVGGNVGNSKWYDVAPNLRPEALRLMNNSHKQRQSVCPCDSKYKRSV